MRDRIQKIMESEQLLPSVFADKLGIGRAVMSHILNGRNNPSLDVVTRILQSMDFIDSNWLLTGDGNMYKNKTNISSSNSSYLDFSDESESHLFGANENLLDKEEKKSNHVPEPAKKPTSSSVNTEYRRENIVNPPRNSIENTEYKPPIVEKMVSKNIDKIIIYYTDNTFEVFEPNKKSI